MVAFLTDPFDARSTVVSVGLVLTDYAEQHTKQSCVLLNKYPGTGETGLLAPQLLDTIRI